MPGKSRSRKDRRVAHNRIKASTAQSVSPVLSSVSARDQKTVAAPKAVEASANVVVPVARASAKPKIYINRDLRTTALLAGIMLVILIVVSLISR